MTKPYTIIRRFLFEFVDEFSQKEKLLLSLKRNYQKVINLLFVLHFELHLNIFETEEILQFWDKRILDVRNIHTEIRRVVIHRYFLTSMKMRINCCAFYFFVSD